MKILYFGTYERTNVRYRVIKKGLELNGVKILECHVPFWEKTTHKTGSLYKNKFRLILNLVLIQVQLFFKAFKFRNYDFIWVSYIGQFDLPVTKLVSKIMNKKLVFDPLLSLSETLTDRGLMKKESLVYRFAFMLDKLSCRWSDLIIIDTQHNLEYFSKIFKIPKHKIHCIYIGADNDIFSPVEKKHKDFTVTFAGKFIPGHGLEYLIDAARILKDEKINFKLIGTGQTFEKIKKYSEGLDNIKFLGWVEYNKLPSHIADADVCLGLFKDSQKIRDVIATKIFESMALKKAIITGDSPAVREILTHKKNVFFCKLADSKSLADAILFLRKDRKLREKIAENAYQLYKKSFTPNEIGESVINCLKQI